jgi:hypothetical protein
MKLQNMVLILAAFSILAFQNCGMSKASEQTAQKIRAQDDSDRYHYDDDDDGRVNEPQLCLLAHGEGVLRSCAETGGFCEAADTRPIFCVPTSCYKGYHIGYPTGIEDAGLSCIAN